MKNIIIGILIGLFLNGIVCFAENVVINPILKIGERGLISLHTTKVTTPEGIYRIFISWTADGVAMTTVKIK